MKLRSTVLLPLVAFGMLSCLLSCGTDDAPNSPVPHDSLPVRESLGMMEEYLPQDSCALVKKLALGYYPFPEPYIWWDVNLGEPFTDLDGDGIFKPGVDIFAISADPALNQDLNHNGSYDGPDKPWSAGVPFDDLNGDGMFSDQSARPYSNEMPYADLNGNGQHDDSLGYRPVPSRIVQGETWGKSVIAYRTDSRMVKFVSDSGSVIPFKAELPDSTYPLAMYRTDSSLQSFSAILLDTGKIYADTNLPLQQIEGGPRMFRSIEHVESVEIDGVAFPDIIRVSLALDTSSEPVIVVLFCKSRGPIAVVHRLLDSENAAYLDTLAIVPGDASVFNVRR